MFYFLTAHLDHWQIGWLLVTQFLPFSLLQLLSLKYLAKRRLTGPITACIMLASLFFSGSYAFFISHSYADILLIHGFMIIFIQTWLFMIIHFTLWKQEPTFLLSVLLSGIFSTVAVAGQRLLFLYFTQFDNWPFFSAKILNWYLLLELLLLPGVGKLQHVLKGSRKLGLWAALLVYHALAVFFIFFELVSVGRYPEHTTKIAVSFLFFERSLFHKLLPEAMIVEDRLQTQISYSWVLPGLFVLGIGLVMLLFFRNIYAQRQLEVEQERAADLLEYVQTVEKLTVKVRQRQHDFDNMLVSLGGYIYEEADSLRLKTYFAKVSGLGEGEYHLFSEMSKLKNIQILPLKALIYSKMVKAQEYNVTLALECQQEVTEAGMDDLDLVRVLGILLDNGIEAAAESSVPQLRLAVVANEQGLVFIVMNSTADASALAVMVNEGESTKGEYRGQGLSIIRQMLLKYQKRVLFTMEKKNELVFQTFKVMKEGERDAN